MAKFPTRKSNNPDAENVVPEITPDWLIALLRKYGEEAEPYGDAPTRPSAFLMDESLPESEAPDDDISDALADIASSEAPPPERSVSSIDWGAPAAEVEAPAPSSAMDDLIASFGEDEPEPPAQEAADIPDWLDDVATTTTTPAAEAPSPAPEIAPPAAEEAEAPDWLDDITPEADEPAPEVIPEISKVPGTDWLSEIRADVPPAEEQSAVPDWLVEFAAVGTSSLVESPPAPVEPPPEQPFADAEQPAQPETTPPAADETDVSFDWPDEMEIPEPEQQAEPAPPPEVKEPAPTFDWPDEMEIPEPEEPAEPAPPPVAEEPAPTFDWSDEMEIPEPEEPAEPAPPPEVKEPAPTFDWLDEMEIPEPEQQAEPAPPPEVEAASDWLADIAETASAEQTPPPTVETPASAPMSDEDWDADWLAEVAAAYPIDPALAESVLIADDLPSPEPAPDQQPTDEADALLAVPALGLSEVPDWLTTDDAEEAPQAEEPALPGDLPDWMQVEPEDRPDWLPDLRDKDEAEMAPTPEELSHPADLPDWLTSVEQETEAEIEALMAVEDTPPIEAEATVDAEAEAVISELEGAPDWLFDLRQEADEQIEAPAEVEEVETPEAADLTLPEWIRTEAETAAEVEAPVEAVEAEEGLDWLPDLQADAEPEEVALPDWMQVEAEVEEIAEDEGEAERAVEPMEAEAEAEAEEVPDWLTEMQAVTEGEAEIEPDEFVEVEAEMEVELTEVEEAALPDWMQAALEPEEAVEAEAPAEASEAEIEAPAEPVKTEETPDWLAELYAETEPETIIEAEAPVEAPEAEIEAEGGLDWEAGAVLGAALGAALISTEDEAERPIEAKAVEPEVEEAAEAPDWLADLQVEADAETEAEETAPPEWMQAPTELEEPAEIGAPAEVVEADETPDWLTGLQAESDAKIEAPEAEEMAPPDRMKVEAEAEIAPEVESPAEPVESKEGPDWLTESQEEGEAEAEIDAEFFAGLAEADAETPAWLTGSQAEVEAEAETQAEALEIEETPQPEWMKDEVEAKIAVEVETPIESPEAEAEVEVKPEEGEGDLDWKAGAALGAAGVALGAALISAGDEPESLTEPEEAELEAPVEAEESDEAPDWLAEMRAEAEPEVEVETPVEAEESDEAPDWLAEMHAEAEPEAEVETPVEAEDADEPPDLLTELHAEAEPEAEEAEVEAEALESEEAALPEWMMVEAEPEDIAEVEVEAPVEAEEAEDESGLDWKAGVALGAAGAALGAALLSDEEEPERPAEPEEAEAESAPFLETPEADEVPGWMAALSETEGQDLERAGEAVQTEAELPAWMAGLFSDVEAEEGAGEEASVQPAEGSAVPDWMIALGQEDEAEIEPSEEETEEGEEEAPSEEAAGLDMGVVGLAAGAALVGIEEAAPSPDLPDWTLDQIQDKSEEEAEDAAPDAFEEALAWMPDLEDEEPSADEIAQIGADIESAEGPAEAKSAIPTWVEELPEPDFEQDDEIGSAERAIGDIKDVVTVPTGAHAPVGGDVSTAAEGAIGMEAAREFYGIVSPSAEAPVARSEAPAGQNLTGKIIRAGLYLLFLALIAIPLFVPYDRGGGYYEPWLVPHQDQQQQIRQELQNAIANKPPDSIALVSFDYTPAVEGEMDPLAAAVISKALGQGLRVIAVSLEPEGQAVARSVLADVSDEYGERVLNLGYLPGGPVAIRQLLDDPLAGAHDVESEGQPLYTSLDNWPEINSIGDFSLVVEIAANPDTARWWAEQLSGAQPDLEMVAAVSAAAEPFVRPYRDSGQYTALISGINGAAALESARLQKTMGPATAMLDSQSVAHLIIMILMFLGTIAGLISKYGLDED